MKKFDILFEKYWSHINEIHYIDSTFEDNIRLLLRTLRDNDLINFAEFLNKDDKQDDLSQLRACVKKILQQDGQIKEISLSSEDQNIPPIKLKVSQKLGSETFSVTVIQLNKPATEQKHFVNSMLESIFDELIGYLKSIIIQGAKPESALDQLPPSEGPNAQPGASPESALPQGEQQPPAG